MTDHDVGSPLTRSITGKPLDALTPLEEDRRRRRHIRILGLVLLVGFLLPVFDKGKEMDFVNFLPFGSEAREMESDYSEEYGIHVYLRGRSPFDKAFPLLYPGIAGAVLLVVCVPMVRRRVRAWWIIGLGTLPFVMGMFTDPALLHGLIRRLWQLPKAFFVTTTFLAAGWVGVFAGARARVYRPERATAYLVGVVGACLYLLALLFPSLPKDAGTLLIATPFVLLAEETSRWPGLVLLFQMLLVLGACFVSFGNVPSTPRAWARVLARLTFRLLMLGAFGGAWTLVVALAFKAHEAGTVNWLVLFGNLVKFGAWFGGLAVLLPVGITDLIVEGPARGVSVSSPEEPS